MKLIHAIFWSILVWNKLFSQSLLVDYGAACVSWSKWELFTQLLSSSKWFLKFNILESCHRSNDYEITSKKSHSSIKCRSNDYEITSKKAHSSIKGSWTISIVCAPIWFKGIVLILLSFLWQNYLTFYNSYAKDLNIAEPAWWTHKSFPTLPNRKQGVQWFARP
jgi:hypothetical protein